MNADKINRWLTLIANISVVAGIVFLAVEVRQNTESQKEAIRFAQASAYQERAFAAASLWSSNAGSPELIEAIVAFEDAGGIDSAVEALAALSAEDRYRIHLNMHAQLAILDNNFYQYRQGYLDEDRYQRIDAMGLKVRIPLFEALGFVQTKAMEEEFERLKQQ